MCIGKPVWKGCLGKKIVLIILNQMINLDQIFRMKLKRTTYRFLILGYYLAAFVSISASSKNNKGSSSPIPEVLPYYSHSNLSPVDSYKPEFDLKADSLVIPLINSGRLLLIDAVVDGEAGNLVFDTGANGLVLNSTYFRDHIKTETKKSNGINGEVGLVEKIAVEKLEFSELSYKNLWADLVNLGHLENRRGIKILGLIGFGMMRNFEIVLDSKRSELVLFRIDKVGKRLCKPLSYFRSDYDQSMEGNGNILFLQGTIAGKSLKFCFDSGAETNVLDRYSNKKILSTITITRRTTLKGAGTSGSEVLFGRMNDFTVGEHQIQNMETVITNLDALSDVYGTHIDGMLGYSFMQHVIICANFMKKQVGIRFTKGETK